MGKAVLAVDDEADVLDTVAAALEEAGFDVLCARSAEEAMVILEQHPEIEIVFTDVRMPGIDGFVLADMIKVRRPDMKIIYATGYIDFARAHPGTLHGAILPKPYLPSQLIAEIGRLGG